LKRNLRCLFNGKIIDKETNWTAQNFLNYFGIKNFYVFANQNGGGRGKNKATKKELLKVKLRRKKLIEIVGKVQQ
jgi:hypothetical protein